MSEPNYTEPQQGTIQQTLQRLVSEGKISAITPEVTRDVESVYRYTHDIVLPIFAHWTERTLQAYSEDVHEHKTMLVYLRDAYPFYRIAQELSPRFGIDVRSIVPVNVSQVSIDDPQYVDYVLQELPKEVRDHPEQSSLWHVDTGVYGTIQSKLYDQLNHNRQYPFAHSLAFMEFIDRYELGRDLQWSGGTVALYRKPEGNNHTLIHLTEGLFHQHPRVKSYQQHDGKFRPVLDTEQFDYYYENVGYAALDDYIESIHEGKISIPPIHMLPNDFVMQQFKLLEQQRNTFSQSPRFIADRIQTVLSRNLP